MVADRILDLGLEGIRSAATRIYLCSQAPSTFAEATATYALGYKAGISIGAPAAGSTGRKSVLAAITGGVIGSSGRATHYAIVDFANSELLVRNSLAAPVDLVAGRTWKMAACDVYSSDATGLFVVEEAVSEMTIPIGETGVSHTFAPVLELHDGYTLGVNASVLWTFADGSTSSSLTPSHAYTGLEDVRLLVTPWAALAAINAGYDGQDGGSDTDTLWGVTTALVSNQYVRGFTNLEVAEALETVCILGSPMTDGSVFAGVPLIRLEAYEGHLTTCALPATMRRLCIEGCAVTSLDPRPCAAVIEDIRGAAMGLTAVTFGTASYPNLRHICVRQNLLTSMRTTNFPALVELFIWNNPGLTGTLTVDSGTIDQISANDCGYSALDLSGISTVRRVIKVGMGGNALTSVIMGSDSFEELILNLNPGLAVLDLSGQTHIQRFNAAGCALTEATVEHILHVLDQSGITSESEGVYGSLYAYVNGGTNAAANANAVAHAASLTAKGWTVTYNEATVPVDFHEDCEDATPAGDASLVNPDALITFPYSGWDHLGLASMRVSLNGITRPHYLNKPLASGTFACGFAYRAASLPPGESRYIRMCGIGNSGFEDVRLFDQFNNDNGDRRIVAWIYGEAFLVDDIVNGQSLRIAISYTANGNVIVAAYDESDQLLGSCTKLDEEGTPNYIRFGCLDPVVSVNTDICFDEIKLDYGTDMHPILV